MAGVKNPKRVYGQMIRCMLHSAGLGPAYWSYTLTCAVYIKKNDYFTPPSRLLLSNHSLTRNQTWPVFEYSVVIPPLRNQGNATLNSTTIHIPVDSLVSPLRLKTLIILMIIQARLNQELTLYLTKHTWLHRQQKLH